MKFPFSSLRAGALAIFSGALVLTMSACNKDNDDNGNIDVPVAGVMAFNLAPDVSSAGLALNGANAVSNLPFGSYTGGYIAVYTGDRALESYNAASGARLAASNYNFSDSNYYSVFVVGTNNNYSNVVVKDDIRDLTATGTAYIRYINAIPDSTQPVVKIGSVVNEAAAYKSVSGFQSVPAGSVAISVSNGGTISANRSIEVEANKIYTVLLSGQPATGSANPVAIKFVSNGTISANSAKSGSASARTAN